MLISKRPIIEQLGKQHSKQSFTCGNSDLDEYLKHRASQDVRRGVSRVFVAIGQTAEEIAGFYTLSAASIGARNLPAEIKTRMPRYPIAAAIIGRLAVALSYQGQGLGAYLLADALSRIQVAAENLAIFTVLVDAKDQEAKRFYLKFGFQELPETSLKLFLPLGKI